MEVEKFTLNERKLISEIHPFSTCMIKGGRVPKFLEHTPDRPKTLPVYDSEILNHICIYLNRVPGVCSDLSTTLGLKPP